MSVVELKLDEYQTEFIDDIYEKLKVHNAIVAQLPTGGGKTVVFSEICNLFTKGTKKDICIFVHKEELLNQTRKTLYKWHNIISQAINANTKSLEQVRIFVAMVETFNNRSKNNKFLDYMKNVGLVIVDEAHLSNFKKIFHHFPLAMRIGFTGTPIAATKKDPMTNYYSDIVVGPSIKKLIEVNKKDPNRGVVRDISYRIKNISRDEFGKKGDDFDDNIMGAKLSKPKQILNTIEAYVKFAAGKKTLCFNANIAHSKLVTAEMVRAGLNARHLDGSHDEKYREDCFTWLRNTPNAILCNVGIATTGFDDPSIECIIINKGTLSYPLWIQMCGRGSRPYQYPDGTYKDHFIVLDMGDNIMGGGHGEWSDDMDWEYAFKNPKVPRAGVAPSKECPRCLCTNPASARVCKGVLFADGYDWETLEVKPNQMVPCGHQFVFQSAVEDETAKEMELVSKNVDVAKTIQAFSNRTEYFTWWKIIDDLCYHFKVLKDGKFEDDISADEIESVWESCAAKTKEWCKLKGKKNNGWYTARGRVIMVQSLQKLGFTIDVDKVQFILEKEKNMSEHLKN